MNKQFEALRTIASYLDLKAQQYAMDYPPEHAIRLTCDRMRQLAKDALNDSSQDKHV